MALKPVKLRTIFAHPAHGCAGPGQIIHVDHETAKALIDGRYADEVDPHPQTVQRESAAVRQPETAMQPGSTPKPAKPPKPAKTE